MSASGMRQIEERHVASKIELMIWCNRMDLLALSNARGEVNLHRLNWQRVWCLSPPSETSKVRGMIWRPDGKVLAVGYSCGTIYLVDVENKEILHLIKSGSLNPEDKNYSGGVSCISWGLKSDNKDSIVAYTSYDEPSIFLPSPPSISSYKKSEELGTEMRHVEDQSQLNILMIGYENGELHLSVFGLFPCGLINLKKILNTNENIKIIDAQLSDDFTSVQVFIESSSDGRLKLVLLNTEVLAAYSDELHSLASNHGKMVGLLLYTDQTMVSIIEAWEQILLEMDSKLEIYADQVPEGGISADFLDLLMLGVPSTELELFLLRDLTAKGLKKFGSSVELSYSTIQKLVLKQLNTVGHDITYHLSELRGLSRIIHRYQILGLDEEVVTQAILSSSAFINKCLELQQVIDHAMKNYKAFFRWLYTVIVRLMDEHVPPEIVKITQQDLTYIAEFLLNFDNVGSNNSDKDNPTEKKGRFNLERLGQYLTDKELTIPPDDDNPWTKFLSENSCIAEHPSIIKTNKNFSLVQQQKHLKDSVFKVYSFSEKSLANQFSFAGMINCIPCQFGDDFMSTNFRVTQINSPENQSVLTAFTDPISIERGFYFIEISYRGRTVSTKSVYYYFHACGNLNDSKLEGLEGSNLKVLDVQFYSNDILSVLLEHPNDDNTSSFVQFPVRLAIINAVEIDGLNQDFLKETPRFNAFSMLEQGGCKVLDRISGWRIAVSGGRKVAVVLSKACRIVRLFEMEVDGEDDDDETLDTTPQSHSTTQMSDASQHVSMAESPLVNLSVRANETQTEAIELDTTDNF